MQPQYKTPGVYTIEQNAFPNSVVEVATAIPAFIGYTQQASYKGKDLSNIPTKVESLKEFQDYFGAGNTQPFKLQAAQPTDTDTGVVEAGSLSLPGTAKQYLVPATTPYYLYSAIQLFYQNGGSTCYIVSVGTYEDDSSNQKDLFEAAIELLVYEQDPTMLLCPDAMRLQKSDDYNDVMKQMLIHCAKVQSRVALFDVYKGAITNSKDQQQTIENFREGVGQNNLNYGIAYFPWVQTSILDSNADVSFLNLTLDVLDAMKTALNPEPVPISPLATSVSAFTGQTNTDLTKKATDTAKNASEAATKAATDADTAAADADTATEHAKDLEIKRGALATKPTDPTAQSDFTTAQSTAAASANTAAQTRQQAAQSATKAIAADKAAADAAAAITANLIKVSAALAGGPSTTTAQVPALKQGDPKQNIFDQAKILFNTKAIAAANPNNSDAENSKALRDKQLYINNALVAQFPAYAQAMTVVARYLNTMPVAPAMAGVYTAVDNSRGVWKAPANVSLNAVVAPTISLSDNDQGNLNVDALTGKSINAIRTFRGLGTMVWGGRTLDGNSQDWRFINVRRTMIMIEQSVKLAARSYVFEPNDANTWTTMKSMINNFLNNLWKQGALAGATPAEAYTVQIGLGSTMTANDILDGYLNVTVLVALVHPAEFIVLTFKQEMQTS